MLLRHRRCWCGKPKPFEHALVQRADHAWICRGDDGCHPFGGGIKHLRISAGTVWRDVRRGMNPSHKGVPVQVREERVPLYIGSSRTQPSRAERRGMAGDEVEDRGERAQRWVHNKRTPCRLTASLQLWHRPRQGAHLSRFSRAMRTPRQLSERLPAAKEGVSTKSHRARTANKTQSGSVGSRGIVMGWCTMLWNFSSTESPLNKWSPTTVSYIKTPSAHQSTANLGGHA